MEFLNGRYTFIPDNMLGHSILDKGEIK